MPHFWLCCERGSTRLECALCRSRCVDARRCARRSLRSSERHHVTWTGVATEEALRFHTRTRLCSQLPRSTRTRLCDQPPRSSQQVPFLRHSTTQRPHDVASPAGLSSVAPRRCVARCRASCACRRRCARDAKEAVLAVAPLGVQQVLVLRLLAVVHARHLQRRRRPRRIGPNSVSRARRHAVLRSDTPGAQPARVLPASACCCARRRAELPRHGIT
jgi:hypothetical protein